MAYDAVMTATAVHGQTDPALQVAVDRLRAMAPVERVILFGSRARGDHDENTDWDLCVLLADELPRGAYTPSSMWSAVRDLGLTLQIVPMRRSVFEARRRDAGSLSRDVAKDGIVLFDRTLRLGSASSESGPELKTSSS